MNKMQRHDLWRIQYRKNRYLRHLDLEELQQRGRETLNNPLTLTDDGKIGILDLQDFGDESMQWFTHYLEECKLRNLDYTEQMIQLNLRKTMPDLTGDIGQRASAAIKSYRSQFGTKIHLVKFGKSKYLQPFLENGSLRIQSASSFSSPEHNQAVGDDEIRRTFKLAISGADLRKILNERGIKSIPERENPEIEITYFTDYWVTCFSRCLSPRLSVDFESDAALIVHDTNEFRRRLRIAFRECVDYRTMKHGPVDYFDPYLPKANFNNIPLIKPLRYYYQQEYRYFWLPSEPAQKLDFIDIKMRQIDDIATLLTW